MDFLIKTYKEIPNKRKCIKCKSIFSSGKEYGNYWFAVQLFEEDLKDGLCEFCNSRQ